jgi:hypothetical protein
MLYWRFHPLFWLLLNGLEHISCQFYNESYGILIALLQFLLEDESDALEGLHLLSQVLLLVGIALVKDEDLMDSHRPVLLPYSLDAFLIANQVVLASLQPPDGMLEGVYFLRAHYALEVELVPGKHFSHWFLERTDEGIEELAGFIRLYGDYLCPFEVF